MIDNDPGMKELTQLWEICSNFIEKHKIYCPETIVQEDNILEDACILIDNICNKIGYYN